jgi:uncharacterized protein
MRILAVSDRVLDTVYCSNVRDNFPGVDLIIGCGDLPFYYLEFLVSALDVPLVYVRGNHDTGPQYTAEGRILTGVQGGIDIHAQVAQVKGLLIAGLEGSMRYRPQAPFMYTEQEMRFQVARLIPRLAWHRQRHGRYPDFFVTHSPPYGIHDQSDLAHTGFRIFRPFMRLFRPRYHLHGHIHLYRQDIPRVTQFEQTTVINVFPYRVIDYEPGAPPVSADAAPA